MQRDLKETLSENLSIPGVKHAVEGGKFRRLLWSVALLGMLGWMCFQLTIRITEFLNKPVSVNMRFINDRQINFPAVTICNTNPLRLSGVKSYFSYRRSLDSEKGIDLFSPGTTYRFITAFSDLLTASIETKRPPSATELERFTNRSTFGSVINDETNFTVFTPHTAHQIDQMLIRCEFGGRLCSADYFEPIFSTTSMCYVFNSNKTQPLETDTPGPIGGLKLLLDAQQYEYMKYDGINGNSFPAGFQVSIQAQDDTSSRPEDDGFLVAAGARTVVSMKHENYSEIPPPKGTCNLDEHLGTCQMRCLTEYVTKSCGCKELYMPGNATQCNLMERLTCSLPKRYETSAFSARCRCQPRCRRDTYPLRISSAPLSEYATYRLKWTHGRREEFRFRSEQLFDMMALYEINNTYVTEYDNVLFPFGSIYTLLENASGYSSDALHFLQHDQDARNSSFGKDLTPILYNLTSTTEKLHLSLKRSYFFDFIQHYPDRIEEDLFTRLAHDLIRDSGRMDGLVAEIKPLTEDIQETISIMFSLSQESCENVNNTDATSRVICHVIFKLYNPVWIALQSVGGSLSSSYLTYQRLRQVLRNDEKVQVYLKESKNHHDNFYKLNYVSLWIYFETLSTFEVTQLTTDTLTNLISDVGGNLGLYLGGSLLTLLEIFDILFFHFNNRGIAK